MHIRPFVLPLISKLGSNGYYDLNNSTKNPIKNAATIINIASFTIDQMFLNMWLSTDAVVVQITQNLSILITIVDQ